VIFLFNNFMVYIFFHLGTETRIQPILEVLYSVSNLYKTVLNEQMKCKKSLSRKVNTAKLFAEACTKDYNVSPIQILFL